MNKFDAFYRFFPLIDDDAERPKDLIVPGEPYSALPALPGDSLRWLVPIADTVGVQLEKLSITIRPKGATGVGTVCGRMRRQAGTTYTEIRLRVDSAPTAGVYTQFALMIGDKNVMGTFRGQQTDIEAYIQAITTYYNNYPFAYVECDRIGREIRIRAYPNDRLRLSGETIGLGIGTVRERNENSPSLLAQAKLNVSLDARDHYDVVVSADIQKGNVYMLDSATYTAAGSEKPGDILLALGVGNGKLSRPGGASVVIFAQAGSQVVANTNKPTLQLLYDSTAGGNDKYIAVVSGDVQPGNTYQIAAAGATTKTVVATSSDTRSTIEAQFNATSGKFVLPAGSVPSLTIMAGSQTRTNSNNPTIRLINKVALPDRVMDQYTMYVGPSVVEGNQYELTVATNVVTVNASASDTTASIASKLGYPANPFVIEVNPGTLVKGVARRGPRYHEPTNLSPVTLISSRTWNNIPYVAEVIIPNLPTGQYQFLLQKGVELIGVSNYVNIVSSDKETALLRFGAERPGAVFGMAYAEDGLMQQVRVKLYIAEPDILQTENLYQTLDNETVRGRTSAQIARKLLTELEFSSFHRNLYFALKHPILYINNCHYRCEGEYQQQAVIGTQRNRRRQATAQLIKTQRYDYQPISDSSTDSLSGTYALIETIAGLDGLWMAAKRLNFVETLTTGMVLPAADYELLIRAGSDPIRLTVGQDGHRVATFLLAPNRLNRVGLVRFAPGRISLQAVPVTQTESDFAVSNYNPQTADITDFAFEQKPRPGDFGIDFNPDYSHQ